MSASLVHDLPYFRDCEACEGRGAIGEIRCPECDGDGCFAVAVNLSALATLAHNLAIGAGLCEALRLWPTTWRPGCGKAAP